MKTLWWRIVAAAVAVEIVYGGLLVGLLNNAALAYQPTGLALMFGLMFLGGLWIGAKATARHTAMGALVGVVAVIIYTALTIPVMLSGELPMTGVFLLNHALKILGSGFGGFIGGKLLRPDIAPAQAD